jgi:ribosomal-protein-serine acetyltransferase
MFSLDKRMPMTGRKNAMPDTYRIDDDLVLRLIEPDQAETFFALVDANRDSLLPWMRWVNDVADVQSVREMIDMWHTMKTETGCMSLGIELDRELVGAVFHLRADTVNNKVEVGYWLAKTACGRGVAARAVRKMLDITFDELGFNRVNIRIASGNKPSLALADRLGLKPEGVTRHAWRVEGEYWDAVEFGVLADEWLSKQEDGS